MNDLNSIVDLVVNLSVADEIILNFKPHSTRFGQNRLHLLKLHLTVNTRLFMLFYFS